jgi:hypothetical protein
MNATEQVADVQESDQGAAHNETRSPALITLPENLAPVAKFRVHKSNPGVPVAEMLLHDI